jgi:hypothetical protein
MKKGAKKVDYFLVNLGILLMFFCFYSKRMKLCVVATASI